MDIDEALNLIQQTAEGYVVWRVDNGEIVRITTRNEGLRAEDRFAGLPRTIDTADPNAEGDDTTQAIEYLSSPFIAAEVTRAFLELQRENLIQQHLRITMFTNWARRPADYLVATLETGSYPPAGSRSDDYILIEYLFDFHWQELNESLLDRLWTLLKVEVLDPLADLTLRLCLLTFERRIDDFVELWMSEFHGRVVFPFLAMKCAGDLWVADQRIIKDLIQILKANIPFGMKHQAMVTLIPSLRDDGTV